MSRSRNAPKNAMSAELLPESFPEPGRPATIRTAAVRRRFLKALAVTASASAAAKHIRVSRNALYEWRKDDPSFKADWDEAADLGTDALEDEAVRRAYEGVAKPIFYGGKKVGAIRDYSDSLLIFLLKARRPDRFRERVDIDPGNKFIELLRYLETAGGGKSGGDA